MALLGGTNNLTLPLASTTTVPILNGLPSCPSVCRIDAEGSDFVSGSAIMSLVGRYLTALRPMWTNSSEMVLYIDVLGSRVRDRVRHKCERTLVVAINVRVVSSSIGLPKDRQARWLPSPPVTSHVHG